MIGIAITTRNRFKILDYTLGKLKENLPEEDYRIIIVDDNSEPATLIEDVCKKHELEDCLWWNPERLGIAKSKNKCLELLGECDYYFLFDDDCYPIHKEFYNYCINASKQDGLNHLIYAKDKVLNGQIKVVETVNNHISFESGTGCFLYFTKKVIEKIGGFNEGYQIYGNEHNGHSYRIFKEGLTPAPYISLKEIDKFVRCIDIDGLPKDLDIPFGSVDSTTQKSQQMKDIRSYMALHKDRCFSYYQPLEPETDKIRIIGYQPKEFGGCIYYRQLLPNTILSMSGFDYEYFENFNNHSDIELQKFDIVSIQKASMPSIDVFKRLKKLGLYIILDLDDWLDVPRSHRLYEQYNKEKVYQFFLEVIPLCDMLTCTTELLKTELLNLHSNVYVFENAVDPEMPQFKIKPTKSDKFRFGYFGGLCHKPDIELLRPVLSQIANYPNCKDKYEMILFGYAKGSIYDEYANILSCDKKIKLKVGNWVPVFQYIGGYNLCDCSLVPLVDDFFNSMKSELKLVEAGFMRKAVIVSGVNPYLNLAKDGVNCLVANSTNDWIQAMKELIRNPGLANTLGENLYNDVKDKYNVFGVNERRKKIYKQAINEYRNRNT